MRLRELLRELEYVVLCGEDGVGEKTVGEWEITGICYDSRSALPGNLFVCLTGEMADGHCFIREAWERGAAAFLVEKTEMCGETLCFPEGAAALLVRDSREALARVSAAWFGYPARRLKVVGVTGTKGKTTVCYMLRQLLEGAGHPTGLIGTVETCIKEERFPMKNTTPESFTIQEYFAKMVKEGCEYAVMEVSSQGLKKRRVEGIPFLAGVFTNLGEDHVGPGEHESREEYRYWKSRLFRQCRIGIGNLDDPQCGYMFRQTCCEKYGYTCQRGAFPSFGGEGGHVLRAGEIRFLMDGEGPLTSFLAGGQWFTLRLPGLCNVYNALAALQTVYALGAAGGRETVLLRGVHVPGRMERIRVGDVVCYIDYAHNAMSLGQALETLRGCGPRRILLVFGCGGNRAVSRRIEMGRTAGRLADLTVVTSDNPRYEDPEAIMADIRKGLEQTAGRYLLCQDREEAVFQALSRARAGDVVLIAGKGHETYQEIQGVRHPMDDRVLVERAAARLGLIEMADIRSGDRFPAE